MEVSSRLKYGLAYLGGVSLALAGHYLRTHNIENFSLLSDSLPNFSDPLMVSFGSYTLTNPKTPGRIFSLALCGTSIYLAHEILQKYHLVNGTYTLEDIISIGLGGLTAFTLGSLIRDRQTKTL